MPELNLSRFYVLATLALHGCFSGASTTVVQNTAPVIVATPANVAADGTTAAVVGIHLLDATQGAVPNANVTVSGGKAKTTITQPEPTDAQGYTQALVVSTQAGTQTFTVQQDGITLGNVAVTFYAGSAAFGGTALTVTPSTLYADGTTGTVRLLVRDVYDNPVSGATVTLQSDAQGVTLTPSQGTTDASGIFEALVSSTNLQTAHVTASLGSVTKQTTVNFVSGSASPASGTPTVTVSDDNVLADGRSNTVITVQVLAANGKAVVSQDVAVAASGFANTLSENGGVTDANGVWTTLLASTKAEQKRITVSAGGAQATTQVTFVAGPASAVNTWFAASPTALTADGYTATTLTLVAADSYGNAVMNQNVNFTGSVAGTTFTPSFGATNSQGVLNTNVTCTKAGVDTLRAGIQSLQLSANVTFTAGAASAANSALSVNTNQLIADNSQAVVVSVTVNDAYGNPVTAQNVTFASSGAGNAFSRNVVPTGSTGAAASTFTSSSSGVKTIAATFAQQTLNTNVAALPGAATSLSLHTSPNTVTADGAANANITVTLSDAFGNLVPATQDTFSSAQNVTFNPNVSATGVSSITSTVAQTAVVLAQAGALSQRANVLFTAGNPNAANSTLSVNVSTLPADNMATTHLTLLDDFNNIVAGQAVTFAASGSGNAFQNASSVSNSSGVATADLQSRVAQVKTVTANFAGQQKSAAVTFTGGAASAAAFSFTVSPTTRPADNVSAMTFTAFVGDALGNPVAAQPVQFFWLGGSHTGAFSMIAMS